MRITKKEDYALLLMGILARNYPGRHMSLTDIAQEINLSPLFLKHIASDLMGKKLIESKEGIGGGYRLSMPPEKIKIADILSAITSAGLLVSCKTGVCRVPRNKCQCGSFWSKLNSRIANFLENISLSDFVKKNEP